MTKATLKRIALPKTWSVPRKSLNRAKRKFVSRPNSGKNYVTSVSINTFMKEVASIATTRREVKYILRFKEVLVNGTRVRDEKFPVGLFDVVSFPVIKESYRVTLSEHGKIASVKIDEKESTLVPKRVEGKAIIKGGKQQLNLFGSANLLSEEKPEISDVLLLDGKKVSATMKLAKGSKVIMIAGRHAGKVGAVNEIVDSKIFIDVDGEKLETLKKYAYVFADSKNEISVR